jgi:hypothetical protein
MVEPFFDRVFVFAITQFSNALLDDLSFAPPQGVSVLIPTVQTQIFTFCCFCGFAPAIFRATNPPQAGAAF